MKYSNANLFGLFRKKCREPAPKKGVKLLERLPRSARKKLALFWEKPAVLSRKRRFFESAGP
jgi:hypothetical protein